MDIIEITAIDQDEEIQQLLMDMKKLYIEMIVQKLITGVGLSLLVIISTILWEENLYGWKNVKEIYSQLWYLCEKILSSCTSFTSFGFYSE